jgi:dienelactone hydrolase
MRPLEILLLLSSLALLLCLIGQRTRTGLPFLLAILLFSVMAAHALLEGPRGPMLALNLVAMLSLVFAAVVLAGWLPSHRMRLVLGSGLILGAVGSAVFAGTILPVFVLPPPDGPDAIGWTELTLDEPPYDLAKLDPEQAPALVRLWYPTAAVAPPPSLWSWFSHPANPAGAMLGQQGAPIKASGTARPVIVYFPGWPGTGIENHVLIRSLVSHGFVVASAEYPRRLPGMSADQYKRIVRALQQYPIYASETVYREAVAQSTQRVRKRAHDASLIVDALSRLDQAKTTDGFSGQLDVEHVGIMGFSLGGATAAQAAFDDPRFKAVMNMDGRHWAEAREQGVRQPYLFISEELLLPSRADFESSNPDVRYNAIEDQSDYTTGERNMARNGGIHVTIRGTAHMNFTDAGLTSPLRRYTGGGPIDPKLALRIVRDYVLAFFGKTLRGEDSPLLSSTASPYPEALVQIYPPPSAEAR